MKPAPRLVGFKYDMIEELEERIAKATKKIDTIKQKQLPEGMDNPRESYMVDFEDQEFVAKWIESISDEREDYKDMLFYANMLKTNPVHKEQIQHWHRFYQLCTLKNGFPVGSDTYRKAKTGIEVLEDVFVHLRR